LSNKDILESSILLEGGNDLIEILNQTDAWKNTGTIEEAIDYFAFNYLVAVEMINYLHGKNPNSIQRGVEQCCSALAIRFGQESLGPKIAEAVIKRVFMIDSNISATLKTSAYDLIDPSHRFMDKNWSRAHGWNSLLHSDPFMSKGLRAKSLARHINKMPGMADNLAKRSNLNVDFPCIKILSGILIHLNDANLNQAFLDSTLTLNSLVVKSLLKRYDGQLSIDQELAFKLKHVQYLATHNHKQKVNKLPFQIEDRAPFIKHLLRHRLLLKPSMVKVLNLSLDDLPLVDPRQHALFKRIVLSRDLEI